MLVFNDIDIIGHKEGILYHLDDTWWQTQKLGVQIRTKSENQELKWLIVLNYLST